MSVQTSERPVTTEMHVQEEAAAPSRRERPWVHWLTQALIATLVAVVAVAGWAYMFWLLYDAWSQVPYMWGR